MVSPASLQGSDNPVSQSLLTLLAFKNRGVPLVSRVDVTHQAFIALT